MKLKVYQQGGGLIYTPFIPEQWADSSSRSSKGSGSSGSDEDNKIDPLDKELLGMMKDQNLLPSDISLIYNKLIQFQRKSQRLSELGDSSYRSVMPGMLQIMNLVSQARYNKADWDAKLSEIKKHDAGAEVAMDSYGRIWVNSEDGLKKVTPSEFDPEQHAPVSNSQLMYYRQRNPALAFQDDLFAETGMDVVGGADVRKEIDDIIDKFGTIKSGEFQKQVFKDIAADLQGEGIFKITTKYSKADLNDFSNLLFSRLSNPAKHLVLANAAIGGYDPADYIRTIITSETDVEVDPSYEASLSKANNLGGAGGSGDEDGKLVLSTYEEHLVWGDFDEGKRQLLQPGNSDIAFYAYVQDVGPIKKDNNDFGAANLDKVFTQADGIGTLIDKSNIYFGDHKVTSNEFSRIMYDNEKNIKRVELPVKEDGSIDFSSQQQADKVQEYLKRNGGMVPDELIEEQLEDIPGAYWDKKKKMIRFKNTSVFFVIEGVASSELVNFDVDSPYITKQPDDSRKDYTDMYNNAINSGYANVPSEAKKNQYNNGKTSKRHLYRANIYMPVSGQVIATALYNHERLPVSSYMAGTPTNMARIAQDRQTVQSNFKE